MGECPGNIYRVERSFTNYQVPEGSYQDSQDNVNWNSFFEGGLIGHDHTTYFQSKIDNFESVAGSHPHNLIIFSVMTICSCADSSDCWSYLIFFIQKLCPASKNGHLGKVCLRASWCLLRITETACRIWKWSLNIKRA